MDSEANSSEGRNGRKVSTASSHSSEGGSPDRVEGGGWAGGGGGGGFGGGCPFSRFGRLQAGPPVAPGATSPGPRSAARRPVNLDVLGECIRKMVCPTADTLREALERTLQCYAESRRDCSAGRNNCAGAGDRPTWLHGGFSELEGQEGLLPTLQSLASFLSVSSEGFQEKFGEELFGICFEENERILRAVGTTLQDFLNSLDALLGQGHVRPDGGSTTSEGPSPASDATPVPYFCCTELAPHDPGGGDAAAAAAAAAAGPSDSGLLLHCFQPNAVVSVALPGLLRASSARLYGADVSVERLERAECERRRCFCRDGGAGGSTGDDRVAAFAIRSADGRPTRGLRSCRPAVSRSPGDLRVDLATFCKVFPFHVMLDRGLRLLQTGDGVRRLLRDAQPGALFHDCFRVLSPPAMRGCSFAGVLRRLNTPFVVRTRGDGADAKVMELKGQMVFVAESDALLFLGSPCVDKLEELVGRGLHLSDIPVHDATRDVVLVGKQAQAQDGLRKRLDKLKETLEQTRRALEEEKKRTVDLLDSIFPGDVARCLWQGLAMPARKFDDVTVLFSDIVGFTAICAQCTPLQVIGMLNALYTRFDHQCGLLDIYKVDRWHTASQRTLANGPNGCPISAK
uniref:guanylate cyclase n=1 Tax=Petromyzon marinus TaxID=7757 RepID=A0AAJ7T931_PETMA|nr:guanylate cyclase soluble subunit alpha-2 isoform X2 [Petromyzon marinus]